MQADPVKKVIHDALVYLFALPKGVFCTKDLPICQPCLPNRELGGVEIGVV